MGWLRRVNFRLLADQGDFLVRTHLTGNLSDRDSLVKQRSRHRTRIPLTQEAGTHTQHRRGSNLLRRLLTGHRKVNTAAKGLNPRGRKTVHIKALPARILGAITRNVTTLLMLRALHLSLVTQTVGTHSDDLLSQRRRTGIGLTTRLNGNESRILTTSRGTGTNANSIGQLKGQRRLRTRLRHAKVLRGTTAQLTIRRSIKMHIIVSSR